MIGLMLADSVDQRFEQFTCESKEESLRYLKEGDLVITSYLSPRLFVSVLQPSSG